MRILLLGLMAGLSYSSAADSDAVKVEAKGTILKSATLPDVFVTPPNCCAGSWLFEKDLERYRFKLQAVRIQPRLDRLTPSKPTYSLRVRDGDEYQLDIDDRFAELFDRQVGRQVTVAGTLIGKRIRAVSVNWLSLK